MKYLKQNKKMKSSSNNKAMIFNFGIPAFRSKSGFNTCPKAGACASGCYALSGAYNWGNVKNAYETRLELTQSSRFVSVMIDEVIQAATKAAKQGKQCFIRIHDSGDFYNQAYLSKWLQVIDFFQNKSFDVTFYCYTKQVKMLKAIKPRKNFTPVYSFGGKEDKLIDVTKDRHSTVFANKQMLDHYDYADASNDDLVAVNNRCVGLVYHGNKAWRNTYWNKALTTIDDKYLMEAPRQILLNKAREIRQCI